MSAAKPLLNSTDSNNHTFMDRIAAHVQPQRNRAALRLWLTPQNTPFCNNRTVHTCTGITDESTCTGTESNNCSWTITMVVQ